MTQPDEGEQGEDDGGFELAAVHEFDC
jgi:hypothetical protein